MKSDEVRRKVKKWLAEHAADPQADVEAALTTWQGPDWDALSDEERQIRLARLPADVAMTELDAAWDALARAIEQTEQARAELRARQQAYAYWLDQADDRAIFYAHASEQPRRDLFEQARALRKRGEHCGTLDAVCYLKNHKAIAAGARAVAEPAPRRQDDLEAMIARRSARAKAAFEAEKRVAARKKTDETRRTLEESFRDLMPAVVIQARDNGLAIELAGLDEKSAAAWLARLRGPKEK